MTVLLSVGFASPELSYWEQAAVLSQDRLEHAQRVLDVLRTVDGARPDYRAGAELRLLLQEQHDNTNRAFALWEQHPDNLSAFWVHQFALCAQLSECAGIQAVEHRGGAPMSEVAAQWLILSEAVLEAAMEAAEIGM